MELAKVEYDRGNLEEGIKNLLKSLDLHKKVRLLYL